MLISSVYSKSSSVIGALKSFQGKQPVFAVHTIIKTLCKAIVYLAAHW